MSAHLSGKVRGWVGAGLAEAAGRLVILSGTTAYLAHRLPPGDFGATALVLSLVTIFSVCVGTPYEEALAQRRVLRRADLAAALAVSLAAAFACILIAGPLGLALDAAYGRDDLALMLPVTASLLLAQGPLAIATAVARRRKAFYAINGASLAAHLAGASVAIGLALAGAGIWSLIGLRIAIVVANAGFLALRLRLAVAPRWSRPHVRDLNRFAGFILLTRLTENATYLVYNVAVGGLFGLTVLGYANIAMRLIEPVRGAIVAVTHNLCFSVFVRIAADRARVAEAVRRISSETTALVAPTFMGLAAVSPILVPLMAGPGWDGAVPIAAALAAGGMVALPSQVLLTALSATGRPQHALYANAAGLAAMVVVLAAFSGMDPVVVGLARLAGDLVQSSATLVVGGRGIALERRRLLREVTGAWIAACVMALAVAALGHALGAWMPAPAALAACVAAGIAAYGLLLSIVARPSLVRLLRLALPERGGSRAALSAGGRA